MDVLSVFRTCRKRVFVVGFAIGAVLAFLFFKTEHISSVKGSCRPEKRKLPNYGDWFAGKGLSRWPVNFDAFVYGKPEGATEAAFLEKEVSVLCAVFVRKVKNARAVKDTWGKHCNAIVFFGMQFDHSIPIVTFQPKNSFHFLCLSINHITNEYHDVQWILFVHDDMFVVPENLRYYVAPLDYNVPYYLGHPLTFWGQIYNVAEAGYVLSKASLKSIQMKFNSSEKCYNAGKYWKNEDFYLGKHLGNMGIFPKDTRDVGDHSRFHGNNFNQLLFPGRLSKLSSYWKKSLYPQIEGFGCCSNKSITFHGVEGDKLYTLEYLVHRLRVFRSPCIVGNKPAPTPFPVEQVWQQFLKAEGRESFSISAKEYFELWQNKISAPDAFNERMRQEHMNDVEATAVGFANMPHVLESMLSAVRANDSDNI
ncbi:Glycoprotein-N-acetylgalactosamine 3-beta-galactosyltransferase 1 [Gryllus bimaculatus]|nr:Glycoprotein-N-acetylgalactosamine 3-beta-galactosyltransferase 1 [Gryllus bimaculatus]